MVYSPDIARSARPLVEQSLKGARVVALLGARQVGKSTLARIFQSDSRPYITLDDLTMLGAAQADPQGFIQQNFPTGGIIDEVQRCPALVSAIKIVVDLNRDRGQFLLTGSANLLTLPRLSESLAGRMFVVELFPFAQSELVGSSRNVIDAMFSEAVEWPALPPCGDLVERIVAGGYPEAVRSASEGARDAWFSNYFTTMVQRDVRDIALIADTAAMGRLLRVLAARSARAVNYASLCSEIEIPKSTLLRYVALLEQTYLLYRLHAWSGEIGRRTTKAPKFFLNDSGLAAFQLGANAAALRAKPDLLGTLVETFAVNELRKHASWSATRPSFYHFRSRSGLEVDLLLETRGGERVGIEIKSAASVSPSDVAPLKRLMDDPAINVRRGFILYGGPHVVRLSERITALPHSVFWA